MRTEYIFVVVFRKHGKGQRVREECLETVQAAPSPWIFVRFSYYEFHPTFNPIHVHFRRFIHEILKEIYPIIIYEYYF